jgi:hypothetical protein
MEGEAVEQRARTRGLAAVAGWAVLAAGVAAVSSFAVNALDNDLAGPRRPAPLTVAEVNSRLESSGYNAHPEPASTPGNTTGPSSTATPPVGGDNNARVASSVGGTVFFRCSGATVTVVSWLAALGYSVAEQPDSAPTDQARIRFESSDKRVVIDIRCSAGIPAVDVQTDNR